MIGSNRIGLWTLLLGGWLVLIIILCSFPWWVDSPRWERVRWIPLADVLRSPHRLLRDAIANFFLYMPLGFAYVRMRGMALSVKLVSEAAVAGLLLSIACESYQVFSPVRYPTMTDVLMNTTGALVGASLGRKYVATKKGGQPGWTLG